MPRPGGPSTLSTPRRHATTPLTGTRPAFGIWRSRVRSAPVGMSASVSRNRPPRDRFTEYATRNDDAVRKSTSTEYGIRSCSRSDMKASASIAQNAKSEQAVEQSIEMIEIEIANLDAARFTGL